MRYVPRRLVQHSSGRVLRNLSGAALHALPRAQHAHAVPPCTRFLFLFLSFLPFLPFLSFIPQGDVGVEVPATTPGILGAGGYMFRGINVSSACEIVATEECLKTNGRTK